MHSDLGPLLLVPPAVPRVKFKLEEGEAIQKLQKKWSAPVAEVRLTHSLAHCLTR